MAIGPLVPDLIEKLDDPELRLDHQFPIGNPDAAPKRVGGRPKLVLPQIIDTATGPQAVVDLADGFGNVDRKLEPLCNRFRRFPRPIERTAEYAVYGPPTQAFGQTLRLRQFFRAQMDPRHATENTLAECGVLGVPDEEKGGHASPRMNASVRSCTSPSVS